MLSCRTSSRSECFLLTQADQLVLWSHTRLSQAGNGHWCHGIDWLRASCWESSSSSRNSDFSPLEPSYLDEYWPFGCFFTFQVTTASFPPLSVFFPQRLAVRPLMRNQGVSTVSQILSAPDAHGKTSYCRWQCLQGRIFCTRISLEGSLA